MSMKKTKEEWQNQSNFIHNSEFIIIGDVINGATKTEFYHNKCGNIISMTPNNHLRRYCKYCSNKHKKTKKEWQQKSDEVHDFSFIILDEPINGKENVRIKHKKCGEIIEMTLNNHINHKNGCRKCGRNSLKSNSYWLKKCLDVWGDEFTILDEVNNVWKKIRVRHNTCGEVLYKDMSNLIHNKRGCNMCATKTYGEDYIKDFLDRNSIKYERQKTFEGLFNPKTNRSLKVDFYITDYSVVIEVDGVQHYKSIEHWGGDSAYHEQKYRDGIKNKFFGDKIIRINNKEIKNIENIWEQLQKQKN